MATGQLIVGGREESEHFPAAVVEDELLLVEHVSLEQFVILTEQLGKSGLLLRKGKSLVGEVPLELLRKPLDLLVQDGGDLGNDLRLRDIPVQAGTDLPVVDVREEFLVPRQDILDDDGDLVHLDLVLADVLPVEDLRVRLVK